ncbi:tetratricopeptide repeat protein [Candidatus Kaiserbacteria bacterium]|nr:tetratricopeptide repeat protein [Candidatus Kaiserbacteria bacterium]
MHRSFAVWVAIVIVVLVACAWFLFSRTITDFYEDVRYAFDPSAALAFELGEKHFSATKAYDYDIVRAEYFFNLAAKDQSIPYVNHELARIAFLKGDFGLALARINLQISLHGSSTANSYYVRGLIEGFMGDYEAAAKDYEAYLRTDPKNWAAINDYAWVLLKDKRYKDALIALDWGLIYWPENSWLHNSRATALFELGRHAEAYQAVVAAYDALPKIDAGAWLQAYPGNDPLIATEGIAAFRRAVEENMHTIELAREKARSDMR